jgi:hypothetical protein
MEDAALEQLAKDYVRAEAKANELRPRLYAGIYEYKLAHGERRGWQTELVKATGLTRERIRQIIAAEEKRRSDQESP